MHKDKYCFYRNINKSIKPINNKYPFVIDQYHLYDLLNDRGWTLETCAPRLRKCWSETNKTVGQCSITAFLVQDIFGGEVYGVATKSGVHCFNKVGDVIFDLTSEQFKGKNIIKAYPLNNPQSKLEHFIKKEKYHRYLKLINNLNK